MVDDKEYVYFVYDIEKFYIENTMKLKQRRND